LGIGFSVKDRNISSFETIEGSGKDLPGYIKKIKAEDTGKPGAGAVKPAGISPDQRKKGGMIRRLWQRMRKR
jgi:hypothetical protein